MGSFDDILAEADSLETQISPFGQSLAQGLFPAMNPAAPMTRYAPERFQVMTPLEGPLMTPARFTDLPAEQQSSVLLDALNRQEVRKRQMQIEQEKIKQMDTLSAFGLNFGDAAALGFGNELAAAIEAPFSDKTYGELSREYGTAKERLYETNPLASIGGAVTGSIAPLAISGGAALLGRATPLSSAITAGRLAPTLGEQAVLGTTGAELRAAASAAGTGAELATRGQAFRDLVKVGALQGGLTGFGGADPTTGMSVEEELKGRTLSGILGAGFGAGTTALLGGAGAAVDTAKKAAKRYFTPTSPAEADAAAGEIFKGLGVTRSNLTQALSDAETSGNPLMKNATSSQLLQNPELATVQAVAEKQPGFGSQKFWDSEKKQVALVVDELNKTVDNINLEDPEAALQLQDKARRYVGVRMKAAHDVGNKMYDDLPTGVEYTRDELKSKFADIYKKIFPAAKGNVSKDIQYAFDYLTKRQFQEGGELSKRVFGKAEATSPRITGQELVSLRSGLLQAGRDLAESNPDQALLANELGQVVHNFIKTDPKFGPKYTAANDFWSNLVDTYHSGPLSNITNKNLVSLDNFNENVTRNVTAWRQFQKQTGANPKVVKEQLALQFDDFAKAGGDSKSFGEAISKKLAWIEKNSGKLTYGSPVDPQIKDTMKLVKTTLEHIQQFLKTAKDARDLVAPGIELQDLQRMGVDDIVQIALSANPKAGTASTKSLEAAIRQFTRDKTRQALSRTLGLAAVGGAVGYGSSYGFGAPSVAAGVAGAGFLAAAGYKAGLAKEVGARNLNEALVGGLLNPQKMLQQLDASTLAGNKATKEASKGLASSIAATPGASSAIGKAAGLGAPLLADSLLSSQKKETPQKAAPANKFSDILEEASTLEGGQAAPEKKEVSLVDKAINAIIPSAEAETRKKKFTPEQEKAMLDKLYKLPKQRQQALLQKYYSPEKSKKIIQKYDKLTQAQIAVESSSNHARVSPRGAIGVMQIMPATAKAYGYNPFRLESNIKAGIEYRSKLAKQFGDMKLGLLAYNWGPGNVQKALNWLESRRKSQTFANVLKYGNVMPRKLPDEARQYVSKIMKEYKARG